MKKNVMKKRGKRFAVAGILLAHVVLTHVVLTHVVLMVFVLGFTGCDWIKSTLGMEEDDPNPSPPSPPEDPVHLRLYVGAPAESSNNTNSEVVPDGTTGNPFLTVAAALDAVAAKYDNDASWQAKVKEWQEEESKSPPNPGKAISAEIVLLSPVTADAASKVITIPATGGKTYPPLILSAQNPVSPGSVDEGDITLSDGAGKNASLLTVGDGVTLTLRNITLKGMGNNHDYSSLVTVNDGGNLILADKAIIRGHYRSGGNGGGVSVGKGGTFTMSGGEIRDNHTSWGGGVYVANDGMFIMSDGKIGDNYASYGGGVSVVDGGTFIMSGGEIGGNSTTLNGGGVYVQDGDSGGRFTMFGGKIGGNHASYGGGVYVQGGGDGVRFAKTGESVIYGEDENGDVDGNSNKMGAGDPYRGNAVCVVTADEFGLDEVVKKRDRTVGTGEELYWPLSSIPEGAANNWDKP